MVKVEDQLEAMVNPLEAKLGFTDQQTTGEKYELLQDKFVEMEKELKGWRKAAKSAFTEAKNAKAIGTTVPEGFTSSDIQDAVKVESEKQEMMRQVAPPPGRSTQLIDSTSPLKTGIRFQSNFSKFKDGIPPQMPALPSNKELANAGGTIYQEKSWDPDKFTEKDNIGTVAITRDSSRKKPDKCAEVRSILAGAESAAILYNGRASSTIKIIEISNVSALVPDALTEKALGFAFEEISNNDHVILTAAGLTAKPTTLINIITGKYSGRWFVGLITIVDSRQGRISHRPALEWLPVLCDLRNGLKMLNARDHLHILVLHLHSRMFHKLAIRASIHGRNRNRLSKGSWRVYFGAVKTNFKNLASKKT